MTGNSPSSSSIIANYKTVKIGSQTWMAENLDYNAPGSRCYNYSDSNCEKYGRLYNWATAMGFAAGCNINWVGSYSCQERIETKHQGICPAGWHIPTNAEWNELYHYADSTLTVSTNLSADYASTTAGKHLKAASGWNDFYGQSGNGLDSYGFAALPGGYLHTDGSFSGADEVGYWWSASEDDINHAYYRYMVNNNERAGWDDGNKRYLYSVRCIQD